MPAEVEQRAQALGAHFEAWLLQHEDQYNAEQRRWLALLGSTLRANAESLDAFTPDHFDFYSAFTALGGQARAASLFGGVQALDDLLTAISFAVFSDGRADAPHIPQPAASRTH